MGRRARRRLGRAFRRSRAAGDRGRWRGGHRRRREGRPRPRPSDVRPLHRRHGGRGKNFCNDLVRQYGYEDEARRIQELYLDGKKQEAEAAVPLELLERVNLVGPASYVKERIEAFRESGVTSLQVTPVGDDTTELVRRLKEWVA